MLFIFILGATLTKSTNYLLTPINIVERYKFNANGYKYINKKYK